MSLAVMGGFETNYGASLFMCTFYISLGSLSLPLNILNIIAYGRSTIRHKYLYQVSYESFEIFDSLSLLLTGIGRGTALWGGYLYTNITVNDCFFKTYWVHTLDIGIEWPCWMVILMSIERICAATSPVIYKKYFSGYTKLYFVIFVVLAGLLSLAAGGISAWGDETINTSRHCAIITSTGTAYSTFHYTWVIFAYIFSFLSLLAVYCASTKVSASTNRNDRDKKFFIMMVMCFISILFVSGPSVVLVGIKWNAWEVSDVVVAIVTGMPGFLTIINMFINFRYRKDYRESFLLIFCWNRKRATAPTVTNFSVSPATFRTLQSVHQSKIAFSMARISE
ncbi:unnamed protein product, partial [Mesorhabditis belari]|uniref:G_PROTEIN_RECEP_F1_2 domain-containing protein n=1 Tax=Mesorhabditis belari TaxID=2138241 RepID=A0AAF3J496_9BILA